MKMTTKKIKPQPKLLTNGDFLWDELEVRHHQELKKIVVQATGEDGKKVRYLCTADSEIPVLNIELKNKNPGDPGNKIVICWRKENKQPFAILAALLKCGYLMVNTNAQEVWGKVKSIFDSVHKCKCLTGNCTMTREEW